MNTHDVIIIGSGPAAYTSGIYAARANLNPIMFLGVLPGGQLMTTTIVENYPGFSKGIDGSQLMEEMKEQCKNAGCIMYEEDIINVKLSEYPYKIYTENNEYSAKTIIIATGATAKKLNLPNGDKFWNKGISACATCDGALYIFRNKPIAVVGGGDTAAEEALHLSKFGSEIFLLVRSDKMRCSKVMLDKINKNPKIKILYNRIVIDVDGNNVLNNLIIANTTTLEKYVIQCNGLFFAIGHEPNTQFLNNQIELDENKYIKTVNTNTNVPGVFAAGDVQDHIYRQAITAAGSGCMAALECEKFLNK